MWNIIFAGLIVSSIRIVARSEDKFDAWVVFLYGVGWRREEKDIHTERYFKVTFHDTAYWREHSF